MGRQATSSEVRAFYAALGHQARVSPDGFVKVRVNQVGRWQSGQWLRDYTVSDDGHVVLTRVDPQHHVPSREWTDLYRSLLV